MNILVSGASGLIGQSLVPFLTAAGYRTSHLVRSNRQGEESEVHWNPSAGEIDAQRLEGFGAVVHLAGEPIAGRWSAAKKSAIRESRVKGTRLLCETLARLSSPPRVLIAASAGGYYGDRGDEVLREESAAGSSFLSRVCQEWEAATKPAAARGIRVVNLRMGFILSPRGGGLARMLPAFRTGAGGRIGSGKQYMSWIGIDDLTRMILFAITTETLSGPVNAVAPNPVTNLEFTRMLGRVLGRPAVFLLPAVVVRLVFGEMGGEVLLASTRMEPARIESAGFQFRFPDLEGALRHLLVRG
jgi:hypothetical protein